MNNNFAKMSAVIFWGILLVSCTGTQAVDILPTTVNTSPTLLENTPTAVATFTPMPTDTPALTPSLAVVSTATLTEAPDPILSEKATIEAFDPLCPNSKERYGIESEISPDGKWIAAVCYRENETIDSPLRVVSMDRSKDWKVYVRDYVKWNPGYDWHDSPIPYRWSKNGNFLYTITGSRASGCCWIGRRYILLLRLNLETGEQLELLNATDYSYLFDVTISNDDRYLMFTPTSDQPYDFAILDLHTWKTKTISLEFPKYFDLIYFVMSPDDDKIVLPLFENIESNDYEVSAIGIIDLITGKQTVMISGLKRGNELFPVRWVDANHVLLSDTGPAWRDQSSAKFWLLNIDSTKLIVSQGP